MLNQYQSEDTVSLTGSEKSSTSRRRVNLACNFCRSRKIRCGGGSPCSNCTAGNWNCEYTKVTPEQNRLSRERKAAAKDARRAKELGQSPEPFINKLNHISQKLKLSRPTNLRRNTTQNDLKSSRVRAEKVAPLLIRQHSFPILPLPLINNNATVQETGLLTPPYDNSLPSSPVTLPLQDFYSPKTQVLENFGLNTPFPSPTFSNASFSTPLPSTNEGYYVQKPLNLAFNTHSSSLVHEHALISQDQMELEPLDYFTNQIYPHPPSTSSASASAEEFYFSSSSKDSFSSLDSVHYPYTYTYLNEDSLNLNSFSHSPTPSLVEDAQSNYYQTPELNYVESFVEMNYYSAHAHAHGVNEKENFNVDEFITL